MATKEEESGGFNRRQVRTGSKDCYTLASTSGSIHFFFDRVRLQLRLPDFVFSVEVQGFLFFFSLYWFTIPMFSYVSQHQDGRLQFLQFDRKSLLVHCQRFIGLALIVVYIAMLLYVLAMMTSSQFLQWIERAFSCIANASSYLPCFSYTQPCHCTSRNIRMVVS